MGKHATRLHRDPRRAGLVATAVVAAITSVAATAAVGLYLLADRSRVVIGAGPGDAFDITGTCAEHACNYLLLGSDSRQGLSEEDLQRFGDDAAIGGDNRSDTIILVHTVPSEQRATFISFPRDLWVEIPGEGVGKINGAFAGGIEGGGAQKVARTITKLTGLPIDHVLYVNLAGFQSVVDAIGGVELCLPEAMVDPLTKLDVPAGCQTFDGATALAYVRTRHQKCDRIPDFARIARQQQFLRAVLAKMLSPSQVLDLPGLIEPVLSNLVTDAGLNPAELAYLAGQLRGVGTSNADFRVAPTYPAWEGDLSVVKLIEPDATKLFRRVRNDLPLGDLGRVSTGTAPSPAVIATAVVDRLLTSGFSVAPDVVAWTSLAREVKPTAAVVLFRPGSADAELMARVVRRYLGVGVVVAADEGALPDGVDVAVVVGPRATLGEPGAQSDGCL